MVWGREGASYQPGCQKSVVRAWRGGSADDRSRLWTAGSCDEPEERRARAKLQATGGAGGRRGQIRRRGPAAVACCGAHLQLERGHDIHRSIQRLQPHVRPVDSEQVDQQLQPLHGGQVLAQVLLDRHLERAQQEAAAPAAGALAARAGSTRAAEGMNVKGNNVRIDLREGRGGDGR